LPNEKKKKIFCRAIDNERIGFMSMMIKVGKYKLSCYDFKYALEMKKSSASAFLLQFPNILLGDATPEYVHEFIREAIIKNQYDIVRLLWYGKHVNKSLEYVYLAILHERYLITQLLMDSLSIHGRDYQSLLIVAENTFNVEIINLVKSYEYIHTADGDPSSS
jgi:hypothetical protein